MTWIALSNVAFNAVENEGFKQMIKTINPRALIRDRTTYAYSKLPLLYETVKHGLNKVCSRDAPSIKWVHFTADHWTSRSRDSYLGVCVQYINADWDFKKFVIGVDKFTGSHTSVAIANSLDQTIRNSAFANVDLKSIVVDQAANMLAGVRNSATLQNIDDGPFSSMHCLDHKLNTALKHAADDNEEISHHFTKLRTLAAKLHQSYLLRDALKDTCVILDPPVNYINIPQYCQTRWNTHHDMVAAVIHLRRALTAVQDDKRFKDLIPSTANFDFYESVFPVLSKAKVLSEWLSTDGILMDKALTKIRGFFALLKKVKGRFVDFDAKLFFEFLLERLNEKFPNEGIAIPQLALGNLLHPFYRGAGLEDDVAKTNLIQMVVDSHPSTAIYRAERQQQQTRLSSNLPASQSIMDEVDDDLDNFEERLVREVLTQPQRANSPTNLDLPPVKEELNRFFSFNRAESYNVDVMEWWKVMSCQMPKLAEIVRGIYSMPCSSASCERAFSTAGKVVAESRLSLTPERMSQLVFINKNYLSVIDDCDVLYVRKRDDIADPDSQDMLGSQEGAFEEEGGLEYIRRFPVATSTPKKQFRTPVKQKTPKRKSPTKIQKKATSANTPTDETPSVVACTPGQEQETPKQRAKRLRAESLERSIEKAKKQSKRSKMTKKKLSKSKINQLLEDSTSGTESETD